MTEDSEFPTGIGAVARRSLTARGYLRYEQLTTVTECELLSIHGVGPKAIAVLKAALEERGDSFAAS